MNWPGAQQVALLDRDVCRAGEVSCETAAIVTSLGVKEVDARTLQAIVRAHWGIENSLHYVRDVTFEEDASRVRKGQAPQVVAALRNTVIGLVRGTGTRQIASALRHFAIHPEEVLSLLGLRSKPK